MKTGLMMVGLMVAMVGGGVAWGQPSGHPGAGGGGYVAAGTGVSVQTNGSLYTIFAGTNYDGFIRANALTAPFDISDVTVTASGGVLDLSGFNTSVKVLALNVNGVASVSSGGVFTGNGSGLTGIGGSIGFTNPGPLTIYGSSALTNAVYFGPTGEVISNAIGSVKISGGSQTNTGNVEAQTLDVTGDVTLSSSVTALKATTASGNFGVGGDWTFDFGSSHGFYPGANHSKEIGDSGRYIANGYIDNLFGSNVVMRGTITATNGFILTSNAYPIVTIGGWKMLGNIGRIDWLSNNVQYALCTNSLSGVASTNLVLVYP